MLLISTCVCACCVCACCVCACVYACACASLCVFPVTLSTIRGENIFPLAQTRKILLFCLINYRPALLRFAWSIFIFFFSRLYPGGAVISFATSLACHSCDDSNVHRNVRGTQPVRAAVNKSRDHNHCTGFTRGRGSRALAKHVSSVRSPTRRSAGEVRNVNRIARNN